MNTSKPRTPRRTKRQAKEAASRHRASAKLAPVKAVVARDVGGKWSVARWQNARDMYSRRRRGGLTQAKAQQEIEREIGAMMRNGSTQAIYFIEATSRQTAAQKMDPDYLFAAPPNDKVDQVVLYYRTAKGTWATKKGRAASVGTVSKRVATGHVTRPSTSEELLAARAMLGTALPPAVKKRIPHSRP